MDLDALLWTTPSSVNGFSSNGVLSINGCNAMHNASRDVKDRARKMRQLTTDSSSETLEEQPDFQPGPGA
jgi:hypothetical protein